MWAADDRSEIPDERPSEVGLSIGSNGSAALRIVGEEPFVGFETVVLGDDDAEPGLLSGGVRETSRRRALTILMVADGLSVGISLFAGQVMDGTARGTLSLSTALLTTLYLLIFIPVTGLYGLYHRPQRRLVTSTFPDLGRIIHAIAASSLLSLFISGAVHRWLHGPSLDRTSVALAALLAVLGLPLMRSGARALLGASHHSRVLVIGTGQVADMVVARLSKVEGVTVVGCIDDAAHFEDHLWPLVPRLGQIQEVVDVVARYGVDHLVVAFSAANESEIAASLRAVPGHVRISVVPRMYDLLTIRSVVDDLRGLPLVDVAPASLGLGDRLIKRAMDIAVSALGLLLTAPLLIAVALAVKLTSEGPILFSQLRTGKGGRPFYIHKFRTMYVDAEQRQQELESEVDGPLFKVRHDPRVTPVGRVLRRLSLDELPQMLNVLIGDMSLVGPRPFVVAESARIEGWAARRFEVRPGMTGLWQVSGRNDLPFAELCRLDYAYVSSWSLWWDLSILWRTPGRVFGQDGAY